MTNDTYEGYTNWETWIVGLSADNDEVFHNHLQWILDVYGAEPEEVREITADFFRRIVYPVANAVEGGKVELDKVNFDELVQDVLGEWNLNERS